MNKIRYFLLILATPLLFNNCQKKEVEVEPNEALEFKLRLLNENLEESTEFKEGENIIFSFYIKNNTSKVMHYDEKIIDGFSSNDFFRVYRLRDDGKGVEDYGIAYDYFPSPLICCPPTLAPPKGVMEYRTPWVSSNNPNHYLSNFQIGIASEPENHLTFLPKGKYYTEYRRIWEYREYKNENAELTRSEQNLRIEFTVK